MKNLKNFSFLILLVFAVGCSRLEIAIDLAPRIVSERTSDALDLSSKKTSDLRKQIQSDLNTIKPQTATKLIDLLTQIEKLLFNASMSELKSADLLAVFDSYALIQKDFMLAFTKSTELALTDLTDQQIEHFKKYNLEKFVKESAETAADADFDKKSFKRYEGIYGFLLDGLNKPQEDIINKFIVKNRQALRDRFQLRKKFTEEFYDLLKQKRPATSVFIERFTTKKSDFSEPPDRAHFINQTTELIIEIWKVAEQDQKNHLKDLLQNYKETLVKISSQK